MAGAHSAARTPTLADALVPLLHASFRTPLDVFTSVVTAPACAPVTRCSSAQLRDACGGAARCARHVRWARGVGRGERRRDALQGDARPARALPARRSTSLAFDSSFPSGHTPRSILAAAALAAPGGRRARGARPGPPRTLALLEAAGRAHAVGHRRRPAPRAPPRRGRPPRGLGCRLLLGGGLGRLRRAVEPPFESLSTFRSSAASRRSRSSSPRTRRCSSSTRSRIVLSAPSTRSAPGASCRRWIASSLMSASRPSRSVLRGCAIAPPRSLP